MAGPLVFVLIVLTLVVVAVGQGQAIVGDAVVGMVRDRDTLLRQSPIRAIVSQRIGAATDLAADATGASRDFVVEDGETAGLIARRLEDEGLVRSALAFLVVVYDEGIESDLHSGEHRLSPAMTPREIAEACREIGLPIELYDERYTTAEAAHQGAKDPDAGAAVVLLEDLLRSRR